MTEKESFKRLQVDAHGREVEIEWGVESDPSKRSWQARPLLP